MTGNRTKLPPSEAANASQALQYPDHLRAFVPVAASTAATTVLASKVAREPLSVEEIVVHMVDPGDGGADSDTFIEVKKNGVTILAAPIGIADEADADTISVAFPSTDELAQLDPGDLLTIETGADIGDVFVGLSIEVRCFKRFDDAVERALLMPNI